MYVITRIESNGTLETVDDDDDDANYDSDEENEPSDGITWVPFVPSSVSEEWYFFRMTLREQLHEIWKFSELYCTFSTVRVAARIN